MSDIQTLPPRSAVSREQTWNLESTFASNGEWEAACQELENLLPRLAVFQGRIADGPQTLLAYLDLAEQAGVLADKIANYAFNIFAVDTTDQAAAGRAGQARGLYARFSAAVAFFNPELVAIGFDRLASWMQATPELAFFTHYLDQLRRRQAHLRSREVEETIALAADAFSGPWSIFSMLSNADLTFSPAVGADGARLEVGQSSIEGLIVHADREVRRTAWEHYCDGYLGFRNSFSAALEAAVRQDVFHMRARGYPSSLHAALEPNNIPVEVFHNLIQVFKSNLPTWQRYWRLRKKALGYDRFQVYDIKAPLAANKPVVSYPQAVEWIAQGMAPLGEEYVQILRRGCLEERWVDWARNKGKGTGAFSSGSHGTQPYIMMSFHDDLFSLSTLAHELGHSLHSYYSWANQRYLYSDYSLFVAEVASNFNQAMVRDYLFRTQTERDFQIALIEEAMSNYHRYFFIMPTLARFELDLHTRAEQGAPINAEILIGLMADLFKEGYGEEVVFDRERIGITWAQFGHMYANFYVYQYATGISGANALLQRISQGEPGAAEAYLDFLKAGGSLYPLEALQRAGVDLTSPEPVERAFAVMAGWVDRLEALVG